MSPTAPSPLPSESTQASLAVASATITYGRHQNTKTSSDVMDTPCYLVGMPHRFQSDYNSYHRHKPFSVGCPPTISRDPLHLTISETIQKHLSVKKERTSFLAGSRYLDSLIHTSLGDNLRDNQGDQLWTVLTHKSQKIYDLYAQTYSTYFPADHLLDAHFVHHYQLKGELGSGGYGFVMAAYHRMSGCEVAVKFIIKSKVPEHAWTEDEIFGRLPVEVIILRNIEHENIVKFIDLFEDSLYLYLVQELHGTPWTRLGQLPRCSPNPTSPTPSLSSSPSDASFPQIGPLTPTASSGAQFQEQLSCQPSPDLNIPKILRTLTSLYEHRPDIHRHASHDLFECIEQTDHKCLTEDQARHVFSQVVEAVHYLDMQGIFHRDIKDENILVDTNFKIKLIDFGSAIVTDPGRPRPFYQQFFGTAAYAASEVLRQEKYQAPPAEIWTLGVLLSYLLTGTSPFATVKDAADGTLTLMSSSECGVTKTAIELLQRCLDPNPRTRATIEEVKAHPWLSKSS